LDEEAETENQVGVWAEQERETDTEEVAGPDWEANLTEREVACLAGQFPQAPMELAESWDGSEGGERLKTEQGSVITLQSGEKGQGRPPAEADRLFRGEEEKEKKFVDWGAVKETSMRQEDREACLDFQGASWGPP
jgi:hypothetical protein